MIFYNIEVIIIVWVEIIRILQKHRKPLTILILRICQSYIIGVFVDMYSCLLILHCNSQAHTILVDICRNYDIIIWKR